MATKVWTTDELIRVAWRRKWVIAAAAVVVSAATFCVARALPNKYRAQTVILVIPQQVPDSYVKATVTLRLEDRLRSINEQILSRPRLEQIINEFQLYSGGRTPATTDDRIEALRRDLKVDIVKGDSFRITYVGGDAVGVARVTERLGSLFIEEHLHDREALAEGTNNFLEEQLADARQRLLKQEKSVAEYRRTHAGELPSQLNSNLQVMQSMELQLQSVTGSISRDRERTLLLERMLAEFNGLDASSDGPPAASRPAVGEGPAPRDAVKAAQANLDALMARFTPQHPDVIAAKRLLATLSAGSADREAVSDHVPGGPEPGVAQTARTRRAAEIRAELDELNSHIAQEQVEEKRMRQVVAGYQSRVEAAPSREADLTELTRDYDTLQTTYRTLLTKKEDSQMAANLERQNIGERFKILDPATVPDRPISPNRRMIDAAGAGGGLVTGAALAVALEYADSTFQTEMEVSAALRLPLLGAIPIIDAAVARRRRGRHRRRT